MACTDLDIPSQAGFETFETLSVPAGTPSHWYAALTRSRHEKRVTDLLASKGVKSYVPLYGKTSRWKDRFVDLQLPLFPGYVFVQIAWRDRLRALAVPGVVRLVSFGGNPVAVPNQEIESIRVSLQSGLKIAPTPYLTVGRRVRIRSGPLKGYEGYLTRRKGSCRLILSVNLIQRSVAVDVDIADVSLVSEALVVARPVSIANDDHSVKEAR